ncbi:MAG: hypothetical protein ACYC9O_14250 [Candidatus Latescibacterota bacterium]
MKHLQLEVKNQQSYVKYTIPFGVKPQAPMPLQIPLDPGGYLEFAFDDGKHILQGKGYNLRFTTDKLLEDPSDWITGELQQMSLNLSLELSYNPQTGKIEGGGGYSYVQGLPSYGGSGAWATSYLDPSKFQDGNSPGFDLSNGLGCSGSLLLELGSGNPHNFYVHLETGVAGEDVDGDGKYETVCWSIWKFVNLFWGPPELKVIWPELPPLPPPKPLSTIMYDIGISALIEQARRGHEQSKGDPGIKRVEIQNASGIRVVLYGRDGSVLSGDMSSRSTKAVRIDLENYANLTLGIIPTYAAGTNEGISFASLNSEKRDLETAK